MDMHNNRKIKPVWWVIVALIAIVGLVIALAPVATSQQSGPDRFCVGIDQMISGTGPNGQPTETKASETNRQPLGVGDEGPLNGGGARNLRYRVNFTCDVPPQGQTNCAGAQITMKIPEAAYRWDSDLQPGVNGRLLQQPSFELRTGDRAYFTSQVDEVNRTVTLTVTDDWVNTSAVGYINFHTSVHASIPGTEELPVKATLGDSEREFTTFAYTYGEPKPTVSKTKNVNDINWIRPGEIFSYSLTANREKT
ncbi:MAG: hypothetical protein SPJ78_04530, partial [Corynebacterium camporealensis]|uniref:hypothetical protein n=1 Tax=Corynebacterium camporealensis TaxID=161896 RepID=UPI002A91EA7A